jgi:hypothetical protein
MRVHSVASVSASGVPTSALSSVDLPALMRPAMATRSGSRDRATIAATVASCGVPAHAVVATSRSPATCSRSVVAVTPRARL